MRTVSKTRQWLLDLKSMLLLTALFGLMSSAVAAADKDPQLAWEKINAGAMVVDVRTAEEFAAGHLPNAINIPFEQIAAQFSQRKIAKDKTVVLYCRSGRRSGIAHDSLVAEGYINSYNGGGYEMLIGHSMKK